MLKALSNIQLAYFRTITTTLISLFICLSGIVQANDQTNPSLPHTEKVSIQLKWQHQFQFAGYYAALYKGFFTEQGLDVTLKPRDLFKNNIQQVLDGEAEYGIADTVLLQYLANQSPIYIVAPIFQNSPQVLFTLKDSNIRTARDLENKRIGFYQKDTDGISILALLNHFNIQAELVRIKPKNNPNLILRDDIDAYAGYLTNEGYYYQSKSIETHVINPAQYGIDLYGDMLFTTLSEKQNHPKRLQAMRTAVLKGWEYALNHKEEVAQWILDTYQPAGKTLNQLLLEAHTIEKMIDPEQTPIGTLDAGRFEYIQKLLANQGLLEKTPNIEHALYNYDRHDLHLSLQERRWLDANPVLKLGIDPYWLPVEFVNSQSKLDGVSGELIHYLEKRLGVKFLYDPEKSWAETLEEFSAGKIDVLSAMTITTEREKKFLFTDGYLTLPGVVATRKGHEIRRLDQLNHKRIAVVKSYASHDYISNAYPDSELFFVNTPVEGLKLVAEGQADGYIDNLAVIGHTIREQGYVNLVIGAKLPYTQNIAMAVHPDLPILQSILKKTIETIPNATLQTMQRKHFQVDYSTQLDWKGFLSIFIPLSLVILIAWLQNLKLNKIHKKLLAQNQSLESLTTKLRGQKNHYELLLNSATDGLHVVDDQGRIVNVSDAFVKMIGYSREELEKLTISDWDLQPTQPRMDKLITSKDQTYQFESKFKRKDGSTFPVHVSVKTIEIDNQTFFYASARDLSEQKAHENSLKAERQKFEYLLENISDGIHLVDANGNLVLFNQSFAENLGYTKKELAHQHISLWDKFLPNSKIPEVIANFIRNPGVFETQHTRKNGEIIDVQISTSRIEMDGKSYLFSSQRDISEQKRIQRLITEQKQELEAILQNSLEGIALTNLDTKFTYTNPQYSRLLGYTEEEFKTLTCADLTKESEREALMMVHQQVLEKGRYENFERFCHHKDGHWVRVRSSISLMPNGKQLLLTSQDVSENYELIQKLNYQSITDPLTQLKNRKAYYQKVQELFSLFNRYDTPFSLVMFDIDRFKSINDQYGHYMGDQVLIKLANALQQMMRQTDFCYRMGGEEFAILLSNTHLDSAIQFAEKIRTYVKSNIQIDNQKNLTISLGVDMAHPDDTEESLYQRVDSRLYKAKQAGRDRTVSN